MGLAPCFSFHSFPFFFFSLFLSSGRFSVGPWRTNPPVRRGGYPFPGRWGLRRVLKCSLRSARTVLAPSRIPRTSPATVVASRLPNNHRFSTLCSLLVGATSKAPPGLSVLLSIELNPRFPDACGVFLKGRGLSTERSEGRVQPRKEHPVRVPAASREVETVRQWPRAVLEKAAGRQPTITTQAVADAAPRQSCRPSPHRPRPPWTPSSSPPPSLPSPKSATRRNCSPSSSPPSSAARGRSCSVSWSRPWPTTPSLPRSAPG